MEFSAPAGPRTRSEPYRMLPPATRRHHPQAALCLVGGQVLVSRVVNSCDISGEGVEDLLGGLGPHERFGIGVPAGDPGAYVGFEGLHRLVDAAADELFGEVGEPAFDLVDPRGA